MKITISIGTGNNSKLAYVNPVSMFSSEDLPAPDGPIMAVSSPDRNEPDKSFRTIFVSIW